MLSNYCNRSPFIGNMVALRANATSRVRIIAQHSTVRKRSQRRVAPLSAFNDRSFSQSATEIASESIDPTLRRAVEQAVVNRRGKVTVGDVAADAGAGDYRERPIPGICLRQRVHRGKCRWGVSGRFHRPCLRICPGSIGRI